MTETAPLTDAQLLMWIGHSLNPDLPTFNLPFAFTIDGPVNPLHFAAAFQSLIDRSDILRTHFAEIEGTPRQIVLAERPFSLPIHDVSAAPDPLAAATTWCQAQARTALDLNEQPFDSALLQLGPKRFLWYLNIHHILSDGRAYELLYQQMSATYALAAAGALATVPALPRFHAIVAAEATARGSERYKRIAARWPTTAAAGVDPLTYYGDTNTTVAAAERRLSHALGLARSARLRQVAQTDAIRSLNEPLTLLNIFTALLAVYLYRATGRRDIAVGMPFHNRTSDEAQKAIGLFQALYPVKLSVDPDHSFADLVQQSSTAVWRILRQARFGTANPVPQQTYNVLLNVPNVTFPPFNGWPTAVKWHHPGAGDGQRTLFLQVVDFSASGALTLHFDANSGLFDEPLQAAMVAQFDHILDQFLANPQQAIRHVTLVPPAEAQHILEDFNATVADYPATATLADLFEAQVERTPNDSALIFGETSFSYAQFNERANWLAHYLQQRGVGPGVPVAVAADRSPELMLALLAIFKAGGGYLPLDISYPRERLSFMLRDTAAPLLLTQTHRRDELPVPPDAVVCLDTLLADWTAHPPAGHNPTRQSCPDDLGYLIYTSGSTGQPKGVAMPQRAIVNLVWWQIHSATRLTRPRTLQFTPLSFDVSLQETFACWCSGGVLVLPTEAVRQDPTATLDLLIEAEVEQLYIIFTPLGQLAETAVRLNRFPTKLREVISAGEQVQITPAVAQFFAAMPGCALDNQYGPSETHIVTGYPLVGRPPDWPALPSIGRPIANTTCYILNADFQTQPLGMAGELYIGGVQVATGYLNRARQTAERFIPDPSSPTPGARLYKTGDLARYLPDGNIDFLGRLDHQVKIRGYRIELGEIETILSRHPAVRDTTVIAREDSPGQKRLVAYVVPTAAPPTTEALRSYLLDQLPDYMVPAAFVNLDTIPQTPNGKVDRRALPAPSGDRPDLDTVYVAPTNEIEQAIAALWRQALQLDQVGLEDNFFTLGGDSLQLARIHDQLRRRFDTAMSVVDMFRFPTIRLLAGHIAQIPADDSALSAAQARAHKQRAARSRRRR